MNKEPTLDKLRRLFPEVEQGIPLDVWLPIVLANYEELLESFEDVVNDLHELRQSLDYEMGY